MSGKYDRDDVVFSIHAGQGGTEACDWVEMLLRMYLRYFEKKGWKVEITNKLKGEVNDGNKESNNGNISKNETK